MMPVAHPSLLALLARRAQSSAVSDSASNDSMNNNKHNTQSVLDAASALASLAALPPPPLVRRGSSSTTPSSPSSSSFIESFSRSPNDRTPSPDCGKGVCAAVSPTYSSSHGSPNATVYNAAGTAAEKKKELMKNSHSKKFPEKLMDIISDSSNAEVITWLPHGRSFYVISPERLSRNVLPAHFFRGGVRPHGSGGGMPRQFSSFVRRLYRWGFKLISRGPDADSFYHPLFRRDDPKLCRKISSCARKEVRDGCPEMHQGIVGCGTPSSHGSIGRDSLRVVEKNESAAKKKEDNDERQLRSSLLERNDPMTTATKKITEIGASSNNEQCAVSEERVQALREQVLIKESILKAKKMRLQRLQYECERLSREATTRQMTHSAAVNAAPAKLHELSMPKNSDSGGNQCEMVGTHNISSFDNCHIDERSQGLPSSPVLVSTSTLENLYDGDNRRILALRNKMNAAWRESSPPTTAVALPFLRSQVYCTNSPGADLGSSSKLLKRASHYNPFTSQEAEILKRAIEVLERDGC